jgi:hypothetical protein
MPFDVGKKSPARRLVAPSLLPLLPVGSEIRVADHVGHEIDSVPPAKQRPAAIVAGAQVVSTDQQRLIDNRMPRRVELEST